MQGRSGRLIEFLDGNPLPWLYFDHKKQKFIMIVDNHLMSTYRACPQHFVYAHVQGIRRKAQNVTQVSAGQRVWFLEFGIVLHTMLDLYYKKFREPDFDWIAFCTTRACEEWHKNNMDEFSTQKEFITIGGLKGFIGLLVQYAVIFKPENERLRVLATEISFGKRLEVLLYADEYFEVYLAGRMDVLVDDGYFICPMDHKSFATFKKDPASRFFVDEGPTGYVYALGVILPKIVPEEMFLKRDCSKIMMNLICKAPVAEAKERFKRIVLRKNTEQLERYRVRMAVTAQHILNDMEQVAAGYPVYRNTAMCDSWFMRECTYKDIDRQESREGELVTIQNGFIKKPIWDTEAIAANE